MAKSLSLDPRGRVLSAVADGASHREAAARFGVGAASVSRWRNLARVQGDASPKPQGGDRRSGRVEAQAMLILDLLGAAPDATIEDFRAALADRGHGFGFGTIRRFFLRHAVTRKKRPAMPASRTAPTSRSAGGPGSTPSPISIPRS